MKENALNVVLTTLKAGTPLREHEPRGPATVFMLAGRIRVAMDGAEEELGAGQLVAFDASVRREAVALEDSAILTTVALEA